MTLYNIKTRDSTFICTKFDDDLNPVVGSSYEVSEVACTCPAGQRPTCRHRHMLDIFTTQGAVDQPAFYNYDSGAWYDEAPLPPPPTAEEVEAELGAEGPEPESLDEATLPEGITMITLDSPEKVVDVHNAIADAVGEPRLRRRNIV